MPKLSLPLVLVYGAIIMMLAIKFIPFKGTVKDPDPLQISLGATQAWPITPLIIAFNGSGTDDGWDTVSTDGNVSRVYYNINGHPTWISVEVLWVEALTGRAFISRSGLKVAEMGLWEDPTISPHLGIQFGRNGQIHFSDGAGTVFYSPCGGRALDYDRNFRVAIANDPQLAAMAAAAQGLPPPDSPCRSSPY